MNKAQIKNINMWFLFLFFFSIILTMPESRLSAFQAKFKAQAFFFFFLHRNFLVSAIKIHNNYVRNFIEFLNVYLKKYTLSLYKLCFSIFSNKLEVEFGHIFRERNCAADSLAHLGQSLD